MSRPGVQGEVEASEERNCVALCGDIEHAAPSMGMGMGRRLGSGKSEGACAGEGKGSNDWSDTQVEEAMGNLLRLGVIIAATVVTVGGALYLLHHGTEPPEYGVFRREPSNLRMIPGIISNAFSFTGQGLIQLGLLLLVATPVARVAFSVVAFLRERDPIYVVITLLVLAILAYSLVGGQL